MYTKFFCYQGYTREKNIFSISIYVKIAKLFDKANCERSVGMNVFGHTNRGTYCYRIIS